MYNINKTNMDNPVYGFGIEYVDDLDLMQKAVTIYTTLVNVKSGDKYLRPMLANVLSYYLLHGYSNDTKQLVLDTLDIKKDNLNQINCELQKKGYLERDSGNYRKKNLSSRLDGFKDFFTITKEMSQQGMSGDRLFAVSLKKASNA